MSIDFDAVVIGAGPAGATAAILLARAGWSVALIEKQPFPRRKVCGECLAASNLPLLDALGIGAAFNALAGPDLRKLALLRGRDSVVADLPAGANPAQRWGRALGRETLDTLLLEQAGSAGALILQPWSVQSVEGEPGAWRCVIRSADSGAARTLKARLAIDAHGSWQALPWSRNQPRRTRRGSDLLAFKANFRAATLTPGLLPVLSFKGGYGGMVVGDAGLTTLACCIRRDRLEGGTRASGQRAGEAVGALLERECAGVRRALRSAARDGAWLAAGPIAPGIRLRDDDQIFRIGNCAGEAHPILGEGMSMALQSAWLLCAQLLVGTAPPDGAGQRDAARRYAADWRRAFAPRVRLAALVAHVAMRPMLAAPLLALARAWPGLLTLGARLGGKARCAVSPALIARLAHAAPSAAGTAAAAPEPTTAGLQPAT